MKKINVHSPELAVWTAVVVALSHRSSLAITPKTPAERKKELEGFACVADDVLELFRGRCAAEADEAVDDVKPPPAPAATREELDEGVEADHA